MSWDNGVYRDNEVAAFMSVGWCQNNPRPLLVIPSAHYPRIYDLPVEFGLPDACPLVPIPLRLVPV